MRYPTELGGQGTGILAEVLWREATSYQCAGIGSALSVPGNIGSYPIYEFGSAEQQQRYLPKLTRRRVDGRVRAHRARSRVGREGHPFDRRTQERLAGS